MNTWTIPPEHTGKRLDLFLFAQEGGLSRGAWQKRIRLGEVLLNNQPTNAHELVKTGDTVTWEEKPLVAKERLVETLPPLEIIAETADWMVINKPISLLVHPAAHTTGPTLVDLLVKHDPAIGRVGPEPERPGIVHRLDRDVSGLMLVAKTANAYDNLQRQFAEHRIKKTYLALVHGEIPLDIGEESDVRFRLSRSTSKGRIAAHPEQSETGKAAWTHYVVVKKYVGATLLHVEILSGRTHQIRAHLFALGHPLVGDPLYHHQKTDRNLLAPRLMLQSIELGFEDPATKEWKSFSLAPDPSFAEVEKLLEK
jgi:23S rRNA pseudouridine1911/1915/1917 synthase